MKKATPITIPSIKQAHRQRAEEIEERLGEFREVWRSGTDLRLWEEMVYCFFTGGCSAKMGLRSVEAVRPQLLEGSHESLTEALVGVHRYPRARAGYVVASREFLREHCGLMLRKKLESFKHPLERRDWLVKEKGIKGLGYKEASHYLRNIGFRGYAILDKHVLRCMHELRLIETPKPPITRMRYLSVEITLKNFSDQLKIDFDEMDLVLWSMRTGEILK
ncbi:MAG TPA: N-glycosylase/DNA lyase [Aridibacter sp.]|nr:N-glycosylase/DNA lyase [Aridibacter sp.]